MKVDDMTQGDLIVSAMTVIRVQDREGQGMEMDGEKSYEGIEVNKLEGKAAIASEPTQGCRCKPRLKRRGLGAKPGTGVREVLKLPPCTRQKSGSHEARRTEVEHKGRPSGAKYQRRNPSLLLKG